MKLKRVIVQSQEELQGGGKREHPGKSHFKTLSRDPEHN